MIARRHTLLRIDRRRHARQAGQQARAWCRVYGDIGSSRAAWSPHAARSAAGEAAAWRPTRGQLIICRAALRAACGHMGRGYDQAVTGDELLR